MLATKWTAPKTGDTVKILLHAAAYKSAIAMDYLRSFSSNELKQTTSLVIEKHLPIAVQPYDLRRIETAINQVLPEKRCWIS